MSTVEQTFISAFITLFLIVDPVGSIPAFNAALKNTDRSRMRFVIIRECIFAFLLLAVFAFFGRSFMATLGLSQTALTLGGALVLLIIALRMLFPPKEGIYGEMEGGEPFFFPIAIPMLAGPSAIATVMLMVNNAPGQIMVWLAAIATTMAVSAVILLCGDALQKFMGKKATAALERLMGLILVVLAVQMFITGTTAYVHGLMN
jgi:MarC family membrane protein